MAMPERDVLSTQSWSKERTLLARLVNEEGTQVTDIAKEIGKSHSVISQYVRGIYKENDVLQSLVRNYCELAK